MPWLCALAELDLNHLNLIEFGGFFELNRIEPAILGAAAKIARGHLIDQIPAAFAMIPADPTLAGVMGEPALFRAGVQGQDRV